MTTDLDDDRDVIIGATLLGSDAGAHPRRDDRDRRRKVARPAVARGPRVPTLSEGKLRLLEQAR